MGQNTIVGVFQSENLAKEVADDLKQEGFSGSDIHIIDKDGKEHQNWFARMFGSRTERETLAYRAALRHGQAVVALDADDEDKVDRAAVIMERHGAIDIKEQADFEEEKANEPMIEPITQDEQLREPLGTETGAGQSIPVIEEKVDIGKRRVLHGGVRVYSHVSETPVEEKVQLTEEKAEIERRPVDRPVSAADESELRDQVIEVVETREEPVVSKSARVVEEVVVGKETAQREETVRDTVRRTDVKVGPLAGETQTETIEIPADIAADFRKNFTTQYAGRSYAEFEMAYNFGYRQGGLREWSGKDFDQVEPQLRREFEGAYPRGDWQLRRNAVRYGWERRRGRV